MRLIYADEAKKNACKWECGGDPSCPYSKSNGITHEQCEFMRAIDECRTIDAVPVKHGHWIDMGDFEQCSACKATHLKEFNSFYGKVTWIRTEYCPHCGTKMDEVAE